MAYIVLDLEECDEEDLVEELNRRKDYQALGLCDYCRRPLETPPCKFKYRHMKQQKPMER